MVLNRKNKILLFVLFVLFLTEIFLLGKIIRERIITRQGADGGLSDCQGEISVANSSDPVEFRSSNTFTVTVRNTGTSALTTTVVDEVWHDRNCDGIEDRLQCDVVGFVKGSDCGWGVTNVGVKEWKDVSLAAGETKQLTWSLSGYVPDYCFVHTLYFWSTPLSSANHCYKSRTYGYEEGQSGNLMFKNNQSKFSASNNMPLLSGTSFGVHTHPDFSNPNTVNVFKSEIDSLFADFSKLRLIRLAIMPWDVATSATTNVIVWKEENLRKIDEMINYALSKNFRIVLTLSPLDRPCAWNTNCASMYNEGTYNDYVRRFYSVLAQRWRNKIYVWNVWNEVDGWCFTSHLGQCKTSNPMRGNPPFYTSSDEYTRALNSALGAARSAIRAVDQNGLVAISLSSYPVDLWYYRGVKILDRTAGNLDVITTSLYPGSDTATINKMSGILDFLRNRYNKPVFVMEVGIPELDSTCSSAPPESGNARQNILLSQFSAINHHAQSGILYELKDETHSGVGDCLLYGILRTNNIKKPSYFALQNYVDANGILPPAPPVIPVSVPSPTPRVPSITPTFTPRPTNTPTIRPTATPAKSYVRTTTPYCDQTCTRETGIGLCAWRGTDGYCHGNGPMPNGTWCCRRDCNPQTMMCDTFFGAGISTCEYWNPCGVCGNAVDNSGKPIPGVKIRIYNGTKNTTTYVTTDNQGRFKTNSSFFVSVGDVYQVWPTGVPNGYNPTPMTQTTTHSYENSTARKGNMPLNSKWYNAQWFRYSNDGNYDCSYGIWVADFNSRISPCRCNFKFNKR